jgi:hypothetical protein
VGHSYEIKSKAEIFSPAAKHFPIAEQNESAHFAELGVERSA